ncbi:RND transporter [Methanocella sp. CWC-04]|uniref:RND transporter n=1 Tax=Methanooceanicella nereidis TaxID=2052831 RepID=A0AAP2W8C5_9EURY|nr:RND family transporter [Methanocella sp. CWC-04]MCD1295916.1 RND transporter [Methanocella sp. CWC-04]
MVRIEECIGHFIKNNTTFIIAAALLLIFLSVIFAGKIYMATGTETLVFKDSQIYKDIEYYNDHFQSTTFLILITSDDVLDPEVLDAMDKLDRQIRNDPKIVDVSGLHVLVREGSEAYYGYDFIPRNKNDIEKLISLSSSRMTQFVVPDRHHTVMTVELSSDVEETESAEVLENVKSTIAWSQMPPGTSAVITGSTAMMLEIQNEMMTSMTIMLFSAIIFMIVALWFTFGHARWRLLPLPIVLIGVIFTGGAMGFTGVPLTMVSMAVFPILIGLGVEYAIQFQNRLMEELGTSSGPGEAVVRTIKNIGPPVFYSMMTTCLGFMAILSSPIPMIFDFGLMCLIGVMVCFLTALFLLTSVIYILSSLSRYKKDRKQKEAAPGPVENIISSIAEITTKNPTVVVFAILLMISGYALDSKTGIEIDRSTFAPQDLPSVVLFRSYSSIMGQETEDVTIQIKAHDVTSPEVVKWLNDFSEYEMANNPEVLSVSSIATAMSAYNGGTIPDTTKAIKDSLNKMPDDIKKRYVDEYKTTGIMRMVTKGTTTDNRISLLERIDRDIQFKLPPAGISASLGGESQMTLVTFGSLTTDRLTMTLLGALSVFLGLLVVYRGDIVKAIVPVLVVFIVTGLSCVVMFLLNMKYTPLSVTLGALTIGIGIDFSILHMERYYEEKLKGHGPEEAMRIATSKIGNAIFSSASTVIAGFGALVMSDFSILSSFGIVTIIDFLLALISAFVIMPPLLVTLDVWMSKKRIVNPFKEDVRS